jgi:two-component system response regulator WspF
LRRTLAGEPDLHICWIAANGLEAVRQCRTIQPDLILMGLSLPVMDGVEATKRIMAERPCPILVVAASVRDDFSRVYEALDSGAVDAATIPGPDDNGGLLSEADLLRRIDNFRTLTGRSHRRRSRSSPADIGRDAASPAGRPPPLVAIGASTGGPKALAVLLSQLPADFPAAIAIVQHLDPAFIGGLAHWLNQCTPLNVAPLTREAPLRPGQVWLAATHEHLILDDGLGLGFTPDPPGLACRPSVDVFFQSVARRSGMRGCGVLLTGMGRDGAAGLLALRRAGFYTIAQDEASSAVFGMPRAAVELDGASAVLPLPAIAGHLVEQMRLLKT